MRAKVAALLLAILVALVAVIVVAMRTLTRDREALLERFAFDRAHQVDEARAEIESDLEGIADDLRLAVRLAETAGATTDLDRELSALVAVARYRAVEIRYPNGGRTVRVTVPQLGAGELAQLETPLAATGAAALAAPERVHTSRPATVAGHWLRVFAYASGGEQSAVAALVVDTEPLFSRLRIVAADPGSRIILLGEHGVPAPATDQILADAIARLPSRETGSTALAELVAHLHARQSGTLVISAAEAAHLGLGEEAAIAVYRPIRVAGGTSWAAALLASSASIAVHDRAIVRRMITVAVLITILITALSAFVIMTTRRTLALRERLRRADEVAQLNELATTILDTIPTGVLLLTGDGVIARANAALRARFDEDPAGKPLPAALADADPSLVDRLLSLADAARDSGARRSLYAESCRLFDEEGSYNFHAMPLEAGFSGARALLVLEDLTVTGKLERQLLRSEKLATIGVLSAGIAHEIGTPLSVARGRAEYTLGKLRDAALARGQRVIIDEIDQVSRTIRRLLDFARAKPATSVGAVDFPAAARNVAELLRIEAERRGLEILLDCAEGLPPLSADPDHLEQVLVNLLMNAFDASASGTSVTIRAESDRRGGDFVRVTVTDQGRGIGADERGLVFDPFYTTKKRGMGTGLGLSIVAQIVRTHGGTIDLESEPSRGTRVSILWPVDARPTSTERANVC